MTTQWQEHGRPVVPSVEFPEYPKPKLKQLHQLLRKAQRLGLTNLERWLRKRLRPQFTRAVGVWVSDEEQKE